VLKIKLLSVVFLLISFANFAQKSLNDYKYIIVPSQYEFQKKEDSFKINSLTKFLFNKEGFITFLSTDDFPDDLSRNRCLALTAELKKGKGLFATKMNFDLVDCNKKVVFSTAQASSREKEYKKAYQQVIRKTFEDIKRQNYKYTPSQLSKVVQKEEFVEIEQDDKATSVEEVKSSEMDDVLYAQPISNGFQLVDSTPKRVYVIKKISVKNIFILDGNNGILYKSNNGWIAEYYQDNKLIKKQLNIKF